MQIEISQSIPNDVSSSALVVCIGEQRSPSALQCLNQELSLQISNLLVQSPHYGKPGEIHWFHYFNSSNEINKILLLGIGKFSSLTSDKIRCLGATAARAAQKERMSSIIFPLDNYASIFDSSLLSQLLVEGVILGSYQFNYYKTQPLLASIEKITLCSHDYQKANHGAQIGKMIGDSINYSRDLVNHPANYMTPVQLALSAEQISAERLTLKILEKEDMEKEGMHALLAVAQGSNQLPKMIVLDYRGNPKHDNVIAFIGKGITFDSGGISIKPSENMGDMKGDMAGGATVLGAISAISKLKLDVNIIGLIPCVENMPSGHAYRPGDVISSMSKKTIEIISTDAEGRLILADAISYAKKLGVNQIIDVATLTGACVVALGNITSGIISNNSNLCKKILDSAEEAGEKMWEFPHFEEYKELIKSDIADLKNSGGKWGGAITAGLFLGEFAMDTPWVHIDIAGTSDIAKDKNYQSKGATGVGVRTLIYLAQTLYDDC